MALMLQANGALGWRDVPFILASTARKIGTPPLSTSSSSSPSLSKDVSHSFTDPTDSDWVTNAAGYHVNHKYGFGLVDATAAVLASQSYNNLPGTVSSPFFLNIMLSHVYSMNLHCSFSSVSLYS